MLEQTYVVQVAIEHILAICSVLIHCRYKVASTSSVVINHCTTKYAQESRYIFCVSAADLCVTMELPISRQCSNCYSYHPIIQGSSFNCFFITLRRSGRSPISHASTFSSKSMLLPAFTPATIELSSQIWEEFESVKIENEYSRDQVLAQSPSRKGDLRTRAPIPWLRWMSPTGREGQTRKQENFEQIWQKITRDRKPMWVTCTFLTTDVDGCEQRSRASSSASSESFNSCSGRSECDSLSSG